MIKAQRYVCSRITTSFVSMPAFKPFYCTGYVPYTLSQPNFNDVSHYKKMQTPKKNQPNAYSCLLHVYHEVRLHKPCVAMALISEIKTNIIDSPPGACPKSRNNGKSRKVGG